MKVVVDTSALILVIFSSKQNTTGKRLYDAILKDKVTIYSCDVLFGEMDRVINTDAKFRHAEKPYIRSRKDMLYEHVRFEPMSGLEHNQAMLSRFGNDWYVIAVAKKRSVDYIVAEDRDIEEMLRNEEGCGGLKCVTVSEFAQKLGIDQSRHTLRARQTRGRKNAVGGAKKGKPAEVNVYDFEYPGEEKAIPYGTYDIAMNIGFVNVGITSDTAEFAVESIRRLWERLGREHYPECSELLNCAD